MGFTLFYRKKKNENIFRAFEDSKFNLQSMQNYIPIYENFFSLNETNYNNIILNHKYFIHSFVEQIDKNNVETIVVDDSGNQHKIPLFLKFSPLLDPIKYMVGKYDISNNNLLNLPKFNTTDCHEKILDKNNSAYTDGFFTYLTSQLLHTHGFIHGLDYYGSFLAHQEDFTFNVVDDIEYLCESDFFNKNKSLFKIDNDYQEDLMNIDSRKYKKKLNISYTQQDISLSSINTNDFSSIFQSDIQNEENKIIDLSDVCIFDFPLSHRSSSTSTCSSRSSHTSASGDELESESESESETDGSISTISDDCINAVITNFPVQTICLEKCTNTLDSLMLEGQLSSKEWISILMQVIMILITYQQVFSLTHNDLHTNNIMYITTEKQYIYYCYKKIHYKVPTFGRIFKIIDFGRGIYKYNGKIICSDSFHPSGDAATQYNCDPYFNSNKPRLEPNFSFDLCRLACSMFDYFVEDLDEIKDIKKCEPLVRLIVKWCRDDKGRNILYKTDGTERYPEFKLYKMIARTVHHHLPHEQLSHYLFQKYITTRKKINRKTKIINIDRLPSYT